MERALHLGKPSDGRGRCCALSVAEAYGIWGKNQWEGHRLACSVSACFSRKPWEALKGCTPGRQTESSWVSSVVEDAWTEEARDKDASLGAGKRREGLEPRDELHGWRGKDRATGVFGMEGTNLKLWNSSPSWDAVTCSILQAAALPRWPAAVGFDVWNLGWRKDWKGSKMAE